MLRSKKYKFIFIHIPKSAGSSIYFALKPFSDPFALKFISSPLKKIGKPINLGPEPLDAHSTAQEIQSILGLDFENYFKFVFIRNPWERVCSDYYYIRKNNSHPAHLKTVNTKDLNEFISKGIYVLRPQCDFIFDDSNNQLVDFIGRYENLEEDFNHILEKLKINVQLKRINSNYYRNYKEILNKESIELIYERYKKDISIFKYNF